MGVPLPCPRMGGKDHKTPIKKIAGPSEGAAKEEVKIPGSDPGIFISIKVMLRNTQTLPSGSYEFFEISDI